MRFWLTTRLNAGIPTGLAARTNGANGLHPPLLLWYDSAQHGQRRYYKGIGNTLQPEFTSEKPQAACSLTSITPFGHGAL